MNQNYAILNWYVIYTYPKAEKKVDRKLKEMGILSFLPLYEEVRQWRDRKKKLKVPLFPNYVFVRISSHNRFDVLKVKEAVRYVSFEGNPAIVSEEIVHSLKGILSEEIQVSNENFCESGIEVTVCQGRFSGTHGVLVRRSGKSRLLIRIDALNTCISIEIPAEHVKPVSKILQNKCKK